MQGTPSEFKLWTKPNLFYCPFVIRENFQQNVRNGWNREEKKQFQDGQLVLFELPGCSWKLPVGQLWTVTVDAKMRINP